MKKLSLLFFTFISGLCYTQDSIKIHPFKGKDDIKRSIKYGNSVKFVIHNVNTFKLDGDFSVKTLSFDFEVPPIFSRLGDKDKNDSIAASDLDKKDISNAIKSKTKSDEFIIEFNKFITTLYKIEASAKLEDRLKMLVETPVFIEDVGILKSNAKDYYESLYSNDNAHAKEQIVKNINLLNTHYLKLKEIYSEIKKSENQKKVQLNGKYSSKKNKIFIEVNNVNISYLETLKFKEEFEFANKSFERLGDPKNREELLTKSYLGVDFYHTLTEANFIAYTDSYQLLNDEVTVTPILKNKKGEEVKKFNAYTFKTIHRLKVNFSSGYLLSFKGDESYSIFKNEDGENIGVMSDNTNDLTHSLGALAHIYWTGEKNVQPGLSSGISLQNDGNIGFYLGGSLLFQEKNRFVLSAGISYTKLNKLNLTNLTSLEDGRREFISSVDTEINYDQVYKPSFFAGITYNLSK